MRYTVFDVETPNYANSRMSAIGIVVVENGAIVDRFFSLVNPETHFDAFNVALTGITPAMAAQAPTFAELWPRIRPMMENSVLAAHNAPFDLSVLGKCLRDYNVPWHATVEYVCTCRMARRLLPNLYNHKLDTLCRYYGITLQHHQADSDAMACAQLLLHLSDKGVVESCFHRTYDLREMCTLPVSRRRG